MEPWLMYAGLLFLLTAFKTAGAVSPLDTVSMNKYWGRTSSATFNLTTKHNSCSFTQHTSSLYLSAGESSVALIIVSGFCSESQ